MKTKWGSCNRETQHIWFNTELVLTVSLDDDYGVVCTHRGGSAPAVKAKARQRIEDAADRMARELLGIATGAESEAVRLAAIKDALDRAGLTAPKTVDVAIGAKPWEQIFDDIAAGPRAESRRRRGRPEDELDGCDTAALETASAFRGQIGVVDAAVVEAGAGRNEWPGSDAEQGDSLGRRTYTLSDF